MQILSLGTTSIPSTIWLHKSTGPSALGRTMMWSANGGQTWLAISTVICMWAIVWVLWCQTMCHWLVVNSTKTRSVHKSNSTAYMIAWTPRVVAGMASLRVCPPRTISTTWSRMSIPMRRLCHKCRGSLPTSVSMWAISPSRATNSLGKRLSPISVMRYIKSLHLRLENMALCTLANISWVLLIPTSLMWLTSLL